MNPLLTTLDNVKQWANITNPDSDAILTNLISRISQGVLSYINRDYLYQNIYTDYYDGNGASRQLLKNWPVISVNSLYINSQAISAGSAPPNFTSGYFLEPGGAFPPGRPQALLLKGAGFCGGPLAVQVTYTAGYVVQGEASIVPSSGLYTVTAQQPLGTWMDDSGVTYANGTALTKVTGTPTTGQYSVSSGVYTFAAADAAQAVLLSYSYVPRDVENAAIEWIIERYNYRTRPSQTNKSVGSVETMGFALENIPRFVKLALQQYARTIPI